MNEILFPALKQLDVPFKLVILGVKNPMDKAEIIDHFKQNENITIEIPMKIDWLNEKGVFAQIKEFDIGVSPLILHDFNVAKSAFKVKQYLSCGVPALASPVGENTTFVKDNFNGFLCKGLRSL